MQNELHGRKKGQELGGCRTALTVTAGMVTGVEMKSNQRDLGCF